MEEAVRGPHISVCLPLWAAFADLEAHACVVTATLLPAPQTLSKNGYLYDATIIERWWVHLGRACVRVCVCAWRGVSRLARGLHARWEGGWLRGRHTSTPPLPERLVTEPLPRPPPCFCPSCRRYTNSPTSPAEDQVLFPYTMDSGIPQVGGAGGASNNNLLAVGRRARLLTDTGCANPPLLPLLRFMPASC